jgi:glutamyl-tRNA synthetase
MEKKPRVRFAPSPTGGLHLGGVRTVLYNYLFARKHKGDFILRIEDTDQSRFVPGAEDYINQCLHWCGLEPDESPSIGGPFAPYRQSERKPIYRQYAEQLVKADKAYYAFDLPEELETMRSRNTSPENPSQQYDRKIRMDMRNSLSLTLEETERLLEDGVPHVIRIKMPETNTEIGFEDMIRGRIDFYTDHLDDKVLLKADGMPTYHLAVVVDDYLMKITHVFRGEEWLPSTPAHILLWEWMFGLDQMPKWAHLPLILKPDGGGKLSKRDGERLGFPVFPLNWRDPKTGEFTGGFKEKGFLPGAFVNLLALLGWNDGSGEEIFSLEDLVERFSIEKVHKAGAKFDYEKAKWFNHEWIKKMDFDPLVSEVSRVFADQGLPAGDPVQFRTFVEVMRDRCTLLTDFYEQGKFFYETPKNWDLDAIRPKWTPEKKEFFSLFMNRLVTLDPWEVQPIESAFMNLANEKKIKPGDLQLPLRIMLVGEKKGPPVFQIAGCIGKEETISRIQSLSNFLDSGPILVAQ